MSSPSLPSGSAPAHPALGATLSLERKLPVLMTAVLAVVLALSLILTRRALTRSADSAARTRLVNAARQVAGSVEGAAAQRASRVREVAADSTVRRALTTRTRDASVVRTLERLRAPVDSGLAVELWAPSGERVLFVGADVPAADRARVAQLAQPVPLRVSPMYSSGGRVYFWVAEPVRDGRTLLGFVAQQRRVTGPREAAASLRGLIGEDVTLYLRNAGDSFWTSAPGVPAKAAVRRDSATGSGIADRPGVGRVITAEAAIGGTPWLAVLEIPIESVRARANATLLTLTMASLALVVIGAVLSWAISRRITRPLGSLTRAAEAIARGEQAELATRFDRDEIGRLASSFNQMATQVAASRAELERQVAEAHNAREEAERANRAKSDFLAVMSHELRTPLNAIGGYAQLLDLEVYGAVTTAQRDALTRIARSQAHLLGLINDVLNFARVDAGQVEYAMADVPLDETLAGLESLVAPQIRDRGLTYEYLECDPRLTVRADREKLQQVVLNLLTNAIKFTEPGGRVELSCEATADTVRIRVQDTGVGIPPERLPTIFAPFVQGHRALNRPAEGVGLGLAISSDLARGMGGEIEVQSEVGRGSVFTVTLPRVSREKERAGAYAVGASGN